MGNETSTSVGARSSYSREEILDIYALGRLWIESGQVKRAEILLHGLNVVAPDFAPGWLGTALVQGTLGNFESARQAAQRALRIEPESAEAMLYVAVTSMGLGDLGAAGTLLGEVGELIESRRVSDPNVVRLYKMQVARYQSRAKG